MSIEKRRDEFVQEIRANIVFEKFIASVLTVASVAGLAHLLIGVIWRASSVGFSTAGAGAAFFAAVSFAFIFFLAGFATSLAIGIPLFRTLEKAKIRKIWPYALASFIVSLIILIAAGSAPTFEAPARVLYLVPGVAAAALFGRKMRPFWIAADRADAAAPIMTLLN